MTDKIRLLLSENSIEDAELVSSRLSGYDIKWVKSKAEFIEALKTFSPDIILSNYSLPSFDGIEAVKEAKKYCPDTPIIIISGTVVGDAVVETLKVGAEDYLLKDRLARLNAAVSRALQSAKERLEKKKSQAQIRMLSAVVKQSTEGMAITDLNYKVIFVNDAWCKMHGYQDAKELLDLDIATFHTREEMEKIVNPFIEKTLLFGSWRGEVMHITKDKKSFPALMETTLLKDEHNEPYALLGIAKDITDLKLVEEEISKHRDRLEELIKERTAELEEKNALLEATIANIKTLSSLLPICTVCKKIRDDKGYWAKVETYIGEHTGTQFSHSICPECTRKIYPDYKQETEKNGGKGQN